MRITITEDSPGELVRDPDRAEKAVHAAVAAAHDHTEEPQSPYPAMRELVARTQVAYYDQMAAMLRDVRRALEA